jgi:hypothetical protein
MASLPDYRQSINHAGYALAQKGGPRLDDMTDSPVFLGIRTIQELSRPDSAALCRAGTLLHGSAVWTH